MRVALFGTCLVDGLFPEVGRATVRLLRRLGHEVEVPLAQTCCGQMHVNIGYPREALPLMRNHVEAFLGYDAVVVPSGSCTGSIRHQHADLARQFGDAQLAEAAELVARHTWELSEFLVDVLGVVDVGAYYPHRVTYHPTCHSLRLLRLGDRPVRLLRGARPGTGGAGRRRVVLRLRRHVRGEEPGGIHGHVGRQDGSCAGHRAEVCTAGDSSCLMHIGGGLSRLHAGTRTVHLAEILAATA